MSLALKVSLIKGRTTERTLFILPLKKQKSMTRGSIAHSSKLELRKSPRLIATAQTDRGIFLPVVYRDYQMPHYLQTVLVLIVQESALKPTNASLDRPFWSRCVLAMVAMYLVFSQGAPSFVYGKVMMMMRTDPAQQQGQKNDDCIDSMIHRVL